MDEKKYFAVERVSHRGRVYCFLQHAGWVPKVYPCADSEEVIVFCRGELEIELFPDFIRVTKEEKRVFLTASYPYQRIEMTDGAISGKDEDYRSAFRVEVV